jgi:hypothetical protein
MAFKYRRQWLFVALCVLVVAGMVYLLYPGDKKLPFIQSDIQKDHSRFTPGESVDVAMAMKLVTHAPPQMLNPPEKVPELLMFPPSEETLATLSGR